MKQLEKKYDHKIIEKNKYKSWKDNNLFKAEMNSNKQKFSIIMPPPNVTGKLHLGHAWDGSIQDFLIRYKKLKGYDTVWIPGMDHAGIATQVKVEQRLKEQGIDKNKIGRENFINKVWEWKDEYASTIRSQWEKLGLAVDYSKEVFTFSDELKKIVNKVFVKMYNEGLIYKGKKIVNWDPVQKTAISNIEVIYKETKSKMFYFKYFLEDKKNFLLVATTRPETMFGDVCVVVNPSDERYKNYVGQKVYNPVNNKLIPIIADDYVDKDFGTGAMKCTPAHDINDFEISIRHNLEKKICMNEDGTLNELAEDFKNLDRYVARKKIVEKCKANNLFDHEEDIINQVGYSERSGAIIEPYLSDQWFVKMKPLAEQVIKMQQNNDEHINFFPKRFELTLEKWMEQAYDWTISRQLWWGHRIPAWYNKNTNEILVQENAPENSKEWIQDESVLDTWFSSGLWPFAAMEWDCENNLEKQNDFFKNYFPSDILVTGYDIIFFWVARMIFQTKNTLDSKPFKNVLIHGLIRDEQGRKMSKSLGNGIDPMDVIEQNGCDSLRYFLLTNSSPGLDLRFSQEKISAAWNFINKLWNASRYVLMNLDENFVFDKNFNEKIDKNKIPLVNKWILNKITELNNEITVSNDKYELTVSGKLIYNFVWDSFCSWFIELSKVNLESQDKEIVIHTKNTLYFVLKNILIMLHPFIPFVTEEIYSYLSEKKFILNDQWMKEKYNYDAKFVDEIILMTKSIREFRLVNNINKSIFLDFEIDLTNSKNKEIIKKNKDAINQFIKKLCNSSLLGKVSQDFASIVVSDYILKINSSDFINEEETLKALIDQKIKLEKELARSEMILNNKKFLSKASKEKIEQEREKYIEYKKQFLVVEDNIKKIKE